MKKKHIWYPSRNYDQRPHSLNIKCIVVHYTDLVSVKESLDILTDPKAKVSSHYLIDVDGTTYQLVKDEHRAWHAGVSRLQGEENVNDFSLGIELQNYGHNGFLKTGVWPKFPMAQMLSLAKLIKDKMQTYNIPLDNIVGHSDVAPGRKIDPGPAFDWLWLKAELQK